MGPTKFTLIKKLPTNKRFNYTPRFYKGKEHVKEERFSTKLDAYNESYNKNDFGSHWHDARISRRNRGNVGFNTTIWIVVLILVFIFLWIIDFDLSIFS
jgi:hypothetical protein